MTSFNSRLLLQASSMQFLYLVSAMTALATVTSAQTADLGAPCSGAGYTCTSNFKSIAVCNGRQWVLAANCGSAGSCKWNLPYT